jgi:hypothetical protein
VRKIHHRIRQINNRGRIAMSFDISEQSILDALRRVPPERWGRVLEFLHDMDPRAAQPSEETEPKRWTIAELRAMPPAERDAILEVQAALVEADYRNDPELTAFEAFGPDDLYVDDTDAPTG